MFWDIIKEDMIQLVNELSHGRARLFRISYSQIILIPKKEGPRGVGDYRSIALLNNSLKIISKILTNRLAPIMEDIIDDY